MPLSKSSDIIQYVTECDDYLNKFGNTYFKIWVLGFRTENKHISILVRPLNLISNMDNFLLLDIFEKYTKNINYQKWH